MCCVKLTFYIAIKIGYVHRQFYASTSAKSCELFWRCIVDKSEMEMHSIRQQWNEERL